MIARVVDYIVSHFLDEGWFARMRHQEERSTRSAEEYEDRYHRPAEGIRDRVTVSEGGW